MGAYIVVLRDDLVVGARVEVGGQGRVMRSGCFMLRQDIVMRPRVVMSR